MTSTQLGRRLGVRQPTVLGYEKAEASKSITLDSLERAANALDCHLVYALVPREPLESLVAERARKIAAKRMRSVTHSMALEGQRVATGEENVHLERLLQKLVDQPGSSLWDDE
jgi:predicted DNA-binding mobile mystery protein A